MIQFKQHQFASFITDLGGATSHTAIVARSLNIPSIVALHHARQLIRENELLIVDGTQGVVIVDPDTPVLAEYQLQQHQFELERAEAEAAAATRRADDARRRRTSSCTPTSSCPATSRRRGENGATGIGLFRTEFLFLNRDDLPDEDEQFEAYREVAEDMEGLPVTIRTSTSAPTSRSTATGSHAAPNPALGLRAIRFCLTEPQMFLTQLRAHPARLALRQGATS